MKRAIPILFSLLTLANAAPTKRPPNIVLIYADDLGAGLLGCYGQQIIKTPNIDRLADEGMRFSYAHGCKYCAPARASLLTGLHDGHRGAWNISRAGQTIKMDKGELTQQELDTYLAKQIQAADGEVFLAQLAQQAGYVTGQFGKLDWGFQTSHERLARHGWNHYVGYYDHQRAHGFYPTYLWKDGEKLMLPGNTHLNAGKTVETYGLDATEIRRDRTGKAVYSQDVFLKEILTFIRTNKERPFFLYHSTQLPHGPVDIPEVHPAVANDERLTDVEKEYASMVIMLDDHVGKIMAELKQLGLDKNTIVFFTSDNGHEIYYWERSKKGKARNRQYHGEDDVFKGSRDLAGTKWTPFQGGLSVPLIARWPGRIVAGTTNNRLTANYDFMPTLAALAAVPMPDGKDGLSWLPTLYGKPSPEHDYIFVDNSTVITRDGWKLVPEKVKGREVQYLLFNLNDDPGERKDVAKRHPEKFARLNAILEREHNRPRQDLPKSEP